VAKHLRVNGKFPFVHRESIDVHVVKAPLSETFKSVVAEHGTGLFSSKKGTVKAKPEHVEDYYKYFETDGVVFSAITNLSEISSGQGFFTTAENKEAKRLCDEFSKEMNLDKLLPRITRNMLIAGFCPVETQMAKLPSKCALKIIHPKTIDKFDLDSNTGELQSITQKKSRVGTGQPIQTDDIALFSYSVTGNDPRGTSLIKPVFALLSYKDSAIQQMDKILKRYASPLAIWKTTTDIGVLKQSVVETEADEDLFLGKIPEGNLKDLVQIVDIDPRARFWEYIQYIDRLIYEGLMAPSLGYWRQATEASAKVLEEIVDRNVHAVQRAVKRIVEEKWFEPLCKKNGLTEFAKLEWGIEKTGFEELDLSAFIQTGLELGYVTQGQFIKILQQIGVRIEPETEKPSGSSTVGEEPEEEPTEVLREGIVYPTIELSGQDSKLLSSCSKNREHEWTLISNPNAARETQWVCKVCGGIRALPIAYFAREEKP